MEAENENSRSDQPIKIPLRQFRVIQRLAAVARVSQRSYLRRLIDVLESISSRCEADPVEILEAVTGGRKD